MVFCTAIEAQIVFETLLALIAGQLAIAGQLGREVHPQSIGLLLGSRRQIWFGGRIQGRRRQISIKSVSKSAEYFGQLFVSIIALTGF